MELAISCCWPKLHPSLHSIFQSVIGFWVKIWHSHIGTKQHVPNWILCKAASLNCRVLLWADSAAGLRQALIRDNANATSQLRLRCSNLNAAPNKQGCTAALQQLYSGTACRALGSEGSYGRRDVERPFGHSRALLIVLVEASCVSGEGEEEGLLMRQGCWLVVHASCKKGATVYRRCGIGIDGWASRSTLPWPPSTASAPFMPASRDPEVWSGTASAYRRVDSDTVTAETEQSAPS